jgi:hypothetical protein
MNQDKAIFMSQAFQKSSFGGLTSLRASPFRGTHCLLKITKYWFLFYRLNLHFIYFSSLIKTGDILIYQNTDGNIKIDVRLEDETVWLTQDQMGKLLGKAKSTISEHIKNIFKEGELIENVVVRNFRITTLHGAIEGKTQQSVVNLYNLDVIISVSYRVKSVQGTQFETNF